MKDALSLRKKMKDKKPDFVRQDSHKKPKLGERWRKPRGLQSKMRLNISGYRRTVSTGYKSPAEVRGLDRNGKNQVVIHTISDLKALDPKKDSILISSSVGKRKKVEILKEAISLKIVINNVKDPQAFVKEVEDVISSKKKESSEKKQIRDKKKAEAEKALEKKKKESEKKAAEEKDSEESGEKDATKEKKELDKILTQKEM